MYHVVCSLRVRAIQDGGSQGGQDDSSDAMIVDGGPAALAIQDRPARGSARPARRAPGRRSRDRDSSDSSCISCSSGESRSKSSLSGDGDGDGTQETSSTSSSSNTNCVSPVSSAGDIFAEPAQANAFPTHVHGFALRFNRFTSFRQEYQRWIVSCPNPNHQRCKRHRNVSAATTAVHGQHEVLGFLGCWARQASDYPDKTAHLKFNPSTDQIGAWLREHGY